MSNKKAVNTNFKALGLKRPEIRLKSTELVTDAVVYLLDYISLFAETFVNFQYVVLWDDMFRFSTAFTLFLATIKISKLLQFNRRIRILSSTLGHAAKPILYFSSMFVIYFFAYIVLAHVWFEQKMYAFSSIYLTVSIIYSCNRYAHCVELDNAVLRSLIIASVCSICNPRLLRGHLSTANSEQTYLSSQF